LQERWIDNMDRVEGNLPQLLPQDVDVFVHLRHRAIHLWLPPTTSQRMVSLLWTASFTSSMDFFMEALICRTAAAKLFIPRLSDLCCL
jgi:hypothetical protein